MNPERPPAAALPKPDGLPQAGDLVAGKYRVERAIGRGGMGAVFAARHEITGRLVALKWLIRVAGDDAEATHRLIREARAASRVRHAHVVDVYDIGEHAGSLFLVMELLEGETLASLLARKGRLSLGEALRILLPVVRGIEVAHRSQVIHRDLKPSNIFLCEDEPGAPPVPRVLDFGVSKVARTPGDNDESLTRTGAVIGTPYYMAPEQVNDTPFDHRIDIYSLGVILYQVLSGRLPFQDASYNALIVKIATATPEPLQTLRPDLPRAVCDIVTRAMARNAADRYAGAAALASALAPFASHTGDVAIGAAPARSRATVALALAALIATAVLAAMWLARSADAPAPVPASTAAPDMPELRSEMAPQPQSTASDRVAAAPATGGAPPAADAASTKPEPRQSPAKPKSARVNPRKPSNASAPVETGETPSSAPTVIKVSRDEF